MNGDEFRRQYYTYQTTSRVEAEATAETIMLEDGSHPVVIGFPFTAGMRYCLMLPRAARFLGRDPIQ